MIHHIDVNPDKLHIHMMSNKVYGLFGSVISSNNEIRICKHEHSDEYKIITNWINDETSNQSQRTKN